MYCENCGAKIPSGANFCEECGAKIDYADGLTEESTPKGGTSKSFGILEPDVFDNSDWKSKWLAAAQKASGLELGIILTDVSTLSRDLNCSALQLKELIANYIDAAHQRDVHYYLLDVAENSVQNADGTDVQSVVDLLKTVCDVARPKYLFILGNEEVVAVASWDNQASDDDYDVLADLPYVTLDTTSPWEGQKYNFGQVLRVGRLPSFDGERLDEFETYFGNAIRGIGRIDEVRPFGLSALVWKDASQSQYAGIASENVYTSPELSLDNVDEELPSDANLLYFNLHGRDSAKFWYGQEGMTYPETFAPGMLENLTGPYFLGVEACYGARYTEGLTPETSVLLSAMLHGCLAFLGSSKIAFGPCVAPGNCADIMIGTYVKKLANGESAGDAYCAAMKDLMNDENPDDLTIKTLAEFSLYGDPSARMGKNKSKSVLAKAFGGVAKGLRVPMPDVRRAVKSMQIDASSKAVQAFQRKLSTNMKAFSTGFNIMDYMQGVEPNYFQVGSKNLFQASYTKTIGKFTQIAKVYFDDNGKIKKTLLSK
ncbi:zinc ribbon domain-containing protein [uncultured Fibrobacter sp.]|uniref:zinc ribbon domain-containing protein n=1 Tax=uncultured Fibrobacter sp. TaxID=261512 RepID=UPI0025FB19C5|nr:zinc ribbon domain-containing protein [uncultured Fibrobacter sp.]